MAGVGIAGYGGDNGPATGAYLNMPWGVAVNSVGDIFIADYQNNYVRKVDHITQYISAYAGYSYRATVSNPGGYSGNGAVATSAELYAPMGLAVDSGGVLYIADSANQRIRKVVPGTTNNTIYDVASGLNDPMGVAVDSSGNLYIAESGNNQIFEMVASNQAIYAIAGNGISGFAGDGGLATKAEFGQPAHTGVYGIAVDAHKNVYIPDANNQRIRVVGANTIVFASCSPSVVGYGQGTTCSASILGSNLTGTVAWTINGSAWGTNTLSGNSDSISGLTTESTGTYAIRAAYSGDSNNAAGSASTALTIETYAQTITFVAPTSPVTYGVAPIALSATATSGLPVTFSVVSGPGTVNASTLTVTGPGTIVVAAHQTGNSSYAPAQQVTQSVVVNYSLPAHGIITTIVGNGTAGYTGDGSLAADAELNTPFGVAVNSSGSVYIADSNNYRIRAMAYSTGNIFTIAGYGLGGNGVVVDSSSNFYISNTVSNRILVGLGSNGNIYLVAGNANGTSGYGGDGGAPSSALLNAPQGVALDASGNLYIADTNNNRIRKITAATNIISTVAGNGTGGFSGDGASATGAKINSPYSVAVDPNGNIYIADTYNNRVRKVTSAGIISTVAGNGTAGFTGDGGSATSAELYLPTGIASDSSGNIYIADYGNNRVRKVTVSTGIISTVAGNGTSGFSGDNGSATSAELQRPAGVALDASGNLYIADAYNNRIRVVGH